MDHYWEEREREEKEGDKRVRELRKRKKVLIIKTSR